MLNPTRSLLPVALVAAITPGPPSAHAQDGPVAQAEEPAPLTWDALPDRMAAVERGGFSGVLLAVRDGREVLRQGYGLADRESGRATTLETIYGIGSTPIDFTVTSALMLGERGQLGLDDSISRFLQDVPNDKRGITIRHLMTGGSGLPDFHDIPGTDWDPDLAWIDRDTAVERILAQPLLFEPGKGDAHSHSAFGLVTAIVEVVSGRTYRDFVRQEILEPLGMLRTGFYGESLKLTAADFATGYGESSIGLPNIPPNWGPTSWLVMGSGGMYSTLGDMQRYYQAIDAGRLLSGEWAAWQQGASVGIGGSERGFFILHATNGAGNRVLMLTNSGGRSPSTRALTRALARIVEPEGSARK